MVVVGEILPANNVVINENGSSVRLMKKGLYEFDATAWPKSARVRRPSAKQNAGGKMIKVDGGHELALVNNPEIQDSWASTRRPYEDDHLVPLVEPAFVLSG